MHACLLTFRCRTYISTLPAQRGRHQQRGTVPQYTLYSRLPLVRSQASNDELLIGVTCAWCGAGRRQSNGGGASYITHAIHPGVLSDCQGPLFQDVHYKPGEQPQQQ